MIRLMEPTDIERVQHIAKTSWNITYEGILPEEAQAGYIARAYSKPMLLKQMEKTIVLVAELENTPVGFASFTKKDEDGDSELTAMFILPVKQRGEIACKLFEYGISMLRDALQLFVYVDANNEEERIFYEEQGFELLEVFEEELEGYPVETAQYVYDMKNALLVY